MQTKGKIKKIQQTILQHHTPFLLYSWIFDTKINCVSKHFDLNMKFIYVTTLSRKKINLHFYL